MEWLRQRKMMVTATLVTFFACALIFAYFEVWAPPSAPDLVALRILPPPSQAPAGTAQAPERRPEPAQPRPPSLASQKTLPWARLTEVEFLALIVDPDFSAMLDDVLFDALLSARLAQLLGVPNTSPFVTAMALTSLPFTETPEAEFSDRLNESAFDRLPVDHLTPDVFAYERLPFDAPVAEFNLVLDVPRQSDWYLTHDMDLTPRLSPTEASILDQMRSDITGGPPSVSPTPPTPPGPPGPPEPPPTPPTPPPNPPPVSHSGL